MDNSTWIWLAIIFFVFYWWCAIHEIVSDVRRTKKIEKDKKDKEAMERLSKELDEEERIEKIFYSDPKYQEELDRRMRERHENAKDNEEKIVIPCWTPYIREEMKKIVNFYKIDWE